MISYEVFAMQKALRFPFFIPVAAMKLAQRAGAYLQLLHGCFQPQSFHSSSSAGISGAKKTVNRLWFRKQVAKQNKTKTPCLRCVEASCSLGHVCGRYHHHRRRHHHNGLLQLLLLPLLLHRRSPSSFSWLLSLSSLPSSLSCLVSFLSWSSSLRRDQHHQDELQAQNSLPELL